jgi:hypothetical protein
LSKSWVRALFIASFATIAMTASAFALDAPTVEPSGGVALLGRLSAGEASGIFRLDAPTGATDVILSAGSLTHQLASTVLASGAPTTTSSPLINGDVLDPSATTFAPSTTSIEPGRPVDVRVTVKGFRLIGLYEGSITIEYASTPKKEPAPSGAAPAAPIHFEKMTVPLNVTVVADPLVEGSAQTAPIKIAKTRCDGAAECALAGLLVDPIELDRGATVTVRNAGQSAATIYEPRWILTGRRTGALLRNDAISVAVPDAPIPAGNFDAVELTVDPQKVQPDVYDGAVAYHLLGVPDQTVVTIQLVVRRGPFFPLALIILGIDITFLVATVGRLANRLAASTSGADQLSAALEKAAEDGKHLAGRANPLIQKKWTGWSNADATAAKDIATDLESLRIVRRLEEKVGGHEGFPNTRAEIDLTRLFVADAKTAEATKAVDDAIAAYAFEAQIARRPPHLETTNRSEIMFSAPRSRLVFSRGGIGRFLSIVPANVRSEAITFAWVVVRFAALAVFVFLGLKVAYVDGGDFTGASLKDWLPLVTWGAGADAVARYLGNLVKGS